MRKLKNGWVELQKLAYPAAILSLLHIVLLRGGVWELYGIVILMGLILRIPTVTIFVTNLRYKKKVLAKTI